MSYRNRTEAEKILFS